MTISITKNQVEELVEKLVAYHRTLNEKFPDGNNLKHIQSYKEFLVEKKVEELVAELLNRERVFNIEVLVVENGNESIFSESQLLLEWEQYKKVPKTNLTYRYDKGKGIPGSDDHIHVFLGNTKNQVYAINKSGTPHDGSKAKLSNKEIKFLKGLGFTPPDNGILEWFTLSPDKEYIAYDRPLLFD